MVESRFRHAEIGQEQKWMDPRWYYRQAEKGFEDVFDITRRELLLPELNDSSSMVEQITSRVDFEDEDGAGILDRLIEYLEKS